MKIKYLAPVGPIWLIFKKSDRNPDILQIFDHRNQQTCNFAENFQSADKTDLKDNLT